MQESRSKTLIKNNKQGLPELRNSSINNPGERGWLQSWGPGENVVQGGSVPTPAALPGANSHWISGGSRGGEQAQTAPLLK